MAEFKTEREKRCNSLVSKALRKMVARFRLGAEWASGPPNCNPYNRIDL
jgi:hypothetical protein